MSSFGWSTGWILAVLAILGTGSPLGPPSASAQQPRRRVLSQHEAAQYGLYRAWYGHFSRAGRHDRISGAVLYVPPALVASTPAQQQAQAGGDQQAENQQQTENEDRSTPYPQAPLMLYVYTEHGRPHAVEAETGRLHWSVQVGNRRFRCEPPAVSQRWIAVIHGLQLKLLDRETGELEWETKLSHTSAVGPAIAQNWILVPSLAGRITGFHAESRNQRWFNPSSRLMNSRTDSHAEGPRPRWYAVADSQVYTPPVATTHAFVWCTIRGNVYVREIKKDKPSLFMVPAQTFVAVRPTVWESIVYVPTRGGFVYAIDTRNGTLQWRHTSADPIFEPVVATNDSVFVVHLLGACHCLERLTGRPRWSTTGIKKILAVSHRRVYALARDGKVVVLDRNSGARVGSLPWYPGDLLLTNLQTDRIYVGTRDGFLICVRELGQKAPLIHRQVAQEKLRSGPPQQSGQGEKPPEDAFDF